jgi:hypothetical protein
VGTQPIRHRNEKEFTFISRLEQTRNYSNSWINSASWTSGMRLAQYLGSARLAARISTTFLEGFTMKSMLMAVMAVAIAVTFSAPSFAEEGKKKEAEKKGHVVVFADEGKKKEAEKKGHVVVFADEGKKKEAEKKGHVVVFGEEKKEAEKKGK